MVAPRLGMQVRYYPHRPVEAGAQSLDPQIVADGDSVSAEVCKLLDDDTSVDLRIVDDRGTVHYRPSVHFMQPDHPALAAEAWAAYQEASAESPVDAQKAAQLMAYANAIAVPAFGRYCMPTVTPMGGGGPGEPDQ